MNRCRCNVRYIYECELVKVGGVGGGGGFQKGFKKKCFERAKEVGGG